MQTDTHTDNGISMLYVEDHRESREVLLTTLEMQLPELRIIPAENGRDGLELFRRFRPEIVVTDINMPLMNGIDMSTEIKRDAPETIIIAVTAYSETELLLRAIDVGINHFSPKPVDHNRLFTVIDDSLSLIRQRRRLRYQAQNISMLSQALEQSPSSVVITDRQGHIEYVNAKFSELTGYSSDEVRGRNVQLLKSGLMGQEVYHELWQTISSGNKWRGEFINLKKNGEPYWEAASIAPLIDSSGTITHYIAVKEDITAAKKAQEEISHLYAALAQRNAELEAANRDLEAFNYTVSHDLRSPVTVIHGFAQLLMDKSVQSPDDSHREYCGLILKEARKMDALIKALLKYSRLSSLDINPEQVDLSQLAFEISLDLRMRSPERDVCYQIEEGIGCSGDRDLLRVVLENLMGNAWKYTAPREKAVISFGMGTDRRSCFVRDNGVGFDNSKAHALFTTFTRLHGEDEFEGFGIGLATVQRIIVKHGGKVWAEGEVDQGATIHFTLPGMTDGKNQPEAAYAGGP